MKSKNNNFFSFIDNDFGVLGLPMRLTVSLIIGTVALVVILAWILNPCIFPGKMNFYVDRYYFDVTDGDSVDVCLNFTVKDSDGHPIKDATILVEGCRGYGSGRTNGSGKANIKMEATLGVGVYEDYLDVKIKARCKETISREGVIKIKRTT